MNEILRIFEPNSINHTKMFLILFCVTLALQVILSFRDQLRFFDTEPAKLYGRPIKILRKIRIPALSRNQFIGLGVMMILSLILTAADIFPRLFIFISLICYFLYFNTILDLSYIKRKTNLIPLVLLIFLVSPSIDNSLLQNSTTWEIILVKIIIAQMYFSAGLKKLRNGGIKWCNGKSLRTYLMDRFLWGDFQISILLARSQKLCLLLSVLTLFFELTFWVIIFFPRLTYIYVAFAVMFHFGIYLTMRINYLKYLSPVYMVFFTEAVFFVKVTFNL